MTEQELLSLGFEKFTPPTDEWEDENWYYFNLVLGKNEGITFITPSSYEVGDGKWYVELFEDESIQFNDYHDLSKFIEIVKNNIIDL